MSKVEEITARSNAEMPQLPNMRDWPRLQYGVSQDTVRQWVTEGAQAVQDRYDLLIEIERLNDARDELRRD